MYDDRALVDLLNHRFDDLISKVDDIKSDIKTELKELETKFDAHEEKDQERFLEIEKIKWKTHGAWAMLMIIVQFAWSVFFKDK